MNFLKNIDTLYNKFFDNKNFKNIDLPFIDGYKDKQVKFLKITDPSSYKRYQKTASVRNYNYRKKHYDKNTPLKVKANTINRRCKHAQTIITQCINSINKLVGDINA